MGFALPMFTLVTVLLLANQAVYVVSEENEMMEAAAASHMAPMSFEERQERRKRQARIAQRNRASAPGNREGNMVLSLSIPNCVEEGMVLMQGYDNYFVKCVANKRHGGFYRVVYLCPSGLRSVEDTSMCIPPPDCAACRGGGDADDMELNGLV